MILSHRVMSLFTELLRALLCLRSMKAAKTDLQKKDACRVENAEKLLKLGKPMRALVELQCLTKRAWRHPWSEKVLWRAAQSLG